MNQDIIKKLIDRIENNLNAIKNELGDASLTLKENASDTNETKIKKGPGPAKPMAELVKGGFLDKPRTAKEVVSALKKRAHNFKHDRVSLVLMRLVRKGILDRDGDGSLANPWKYVKK